MKKATRISWGGRNERVGEVLTNRLLPGEQAEKIGSFVYLGHVYPTNKSFPKSASGAGMNAHPHRGIITLSYLLSGLLRHRDSLGNHCIAKGGDALWMKAGNGIIHDETPDPHSAGPLHAIQFRINLPAVYKEETPAFRLLCSEDIPELELPDEAGKLRIILGACGVKESPLTTYLQEFVFHVCLNPKSEFTYRLKRRPEYGIIVPGNPVHVNGQAVSNSHLVGFLDDPGVIRLHNPGITPADVILFGSDEYTEPMVAEGPFVMTSRKEIAQAYRDFFEGRYGQLSIDPLTNVNCLF